MITTSKLKSLTDEEYCLLLYSFNSIIEQYGTVDAVKWLRTESIIQKLKEHQPLLRDEYSGLVESTIQKLK